MFSIGEELKKPEWKAKRQEILKRDRFKCAICGCDYKTLNIHHLRYLPDREYWDYPNELLITVCKDCHQKIHGKKKGELKRPLSIVSEEVKQKNIPKIQEVYVRLEYTSCKHPTIYINGEKSIVYSKALINPKFGLRFKFRDVRGKQKLDARKDLQRLSELGLIIDRVYVDVYVLADILHDFEIKGELKTD